jgi:hypothetical protein
MDLCGEAEVSNLGVKASPLLGDEDILCRQIEVQQWWFQSVCLTEASAQIFRERVRL